ncbi:alpha/beta fold hydrolase [Ascidiimonas sp. W6]|uniref:alpha/beta fold hydrolase n=1 Tax=Ascidiimonas meishanensis TaxID=3128903 RepID=UPI0030EF75E2
MITLISLIISFYWFSKAPSNEKIIDDFNELGVSTKIRYLNYDSRNVRIVSETKYDTSKPTLLFIHGSIGSSLDFMYYWSDPYLRQQVNIVSYDRIGYGPNQQGEVLNSIAKETDLVKKIINRLKPTSLIIVGYSYGGPIALNYALKNEVSKIVLLAPALYSEYEMIPPMAHLYKNKILRTIVPDIWKSASKEKLDHQKQLKELEPNWSKIKTKLLVIHGKDDWIVPVENSILLKKQIPDIKFIKLSNEGHGLIWSSAKRIQKELFEFLQ